MERKIARYNERITFQKNSVTVDKYGNQRNEWTDYYTCHAYVSTWQKEESEGVTTDEQQSVTFEVRFYLELASVSSDDFQILFHGEAYNIQSVDFMNFQKSIIRLKAERVIRREDE